MTVPGGNTPHLEPDVLADLQEGLLSGPDADTATAHLAGCPACRSDLAALDAVRDRLADVPEVGPLPADLADRLHHALAGAADEPSPSLGPPTVVPLRPRETGSPRGMRVLQAAASLVLALAVAAIGVSWVNGSGDDSDTSASSDAGGDAAGEAAPPTFPVTATGRDWTDEALKAAAPGLASGALAPAAAGRLDEPPAADDKSSAAAGSDSAKRLADAPAARLAGGPALAECATELAGEPVTPLAVDLASYQGQPAAVVLLPTPDDPATVDVFVVEPACPPGEFLYFVRVPRS